MISNRTHQTRLPGGRITVLVDVFLLNPGAHLALNPNYLCSCCIHPSSWRVLHRAVGHGQQLGCGDGNLLLESVIHFFSLSLKLHHRSQLSHDPSTCGTKSAYPQPFLDCPRLVTSLPVKKQQYDEHIAAGRLVFLICCARAARVQVQFGVRTHSNLRHFGHLWRLKSHWKYHIPWFFRALVVGKSILHTSASA
jgi:hypothetical protein